MLSIMGSWLYMGCMVYICGCFLMQIYGKLVRKEENSTFFSVMFSGILLTTFYAQLFSVFYKVALVANLVLILFAVCYGCLQRKYIKARFLYVCRQFMNLSKLNKIVIPVLLTAAFIVFSLCSAGPAKLIDTDWYHAQTIRWIEEYGCVKGVANLFFELGFNNAQHYFDALFSMKGFVGQSLRNSGGFFGLLIFVHGVLKLLPYKKKPVHISSALALWEVVYSIIITAFYADPYTDTLPNIIILFILTEWFSMLENKEKNIEKMGFYCLLGVFATVAKTSAAVIILLSIHPIILLIKEKRSKEILRYFVMGIVVAFPYLLTNIITTGYPVSLLPAFGLPVCWRVDKEVIQYSVDNMIQFARVPQGTMEEILHNGLRWIPGWFMRESISHKILYIGILFLVLYDCLHVCRQLIEYLKKRDANLDFDMLLPRFCVYLGLIYWMFTLPQVKYCWAYLILPVAVVPIYYLEIAKPRFKFIKAALLTIFWGFIFMFGGFYGFRTINYMKENVKEHLLFQQDYENHVFNTVEKNGHTFYVRIKDGDIVCGYYVFPYLDNEERLDELVVGESLGDGFYFRKE